MGRPKAWVRLVWNVLSIILTLIGLIGLPDYIKAWGDIFAMISSEAGRWVFVIMGVGILFLVNGGRLFRRSHNPISIIRLRIEYDPAQNFVRDTPPNGAQARVVVHNLGN